LAITQGALERILIQLVWNLQLRILLI